jgi:hypothetical protein
MIEQFRNNKIPPDVVNIFSKINDNLEQTKYLTIKFDLTVKFNSLKQEYDRWKATAPIGQL